MMTIITYIAQIVFILSVLGVLFIIVRKIPALSKLPEEPFVERLSLKAALAPLFQNIFIKKLEKFLRKFKVFILKIDDTLTKLIKKLRKHSKNIDGSGGDEMPM